MPAQRSHLRSPTMASGAKLRRWASLLGTETSPAPCARLHRVRGIRRDILHHDFDGKCSDGDRANYGTARDQWRRNVCCESRRDQSTNGLLAKLKPGAMGIRHPAAPRRVYVVTGEQTGFKTAIRSDVTPSIKFGVDLALAGNVSKPSSAGERSRARYGQRCGCKAGH